MSDEIDVLVLADHTYDGKSHAAGETYAIDPSYLETMMALGWVRVADDASSTPARTVPAANPAPSAPESEEKPTSKPTTKKRS